MSTTAKADPLDPSGGAAAAQASRQPKPLAGYRHILRFMARRDRVRGPVWIVSFVGTMAASVASLITLYDTQADLESYAMLATADEALKALAGPGHGLDHPTIGAVVMNETQIFILVALALMAIFLMVRHTRAEESTDRAELVRAAPVGRQTSLVAAATWVSILVAAIAAGMTLVMLAFGLETAGTLAFGASTAGFGLVFVAIGAMVAQVAPDGRTANSLGGVVLAATFVLRAVGDLGEGWLSWASPLGWAMSIRAYADERWWVLILLLLGSGIGFAAALRLSATRDLGAGFLSQRPGPEHASHGLSTPLGLAVRLQRGSVLGWAIGLSLMTFLMGVIADQADAMSENETFSRMLEQAGMASVTDSFLATIVLLAAITTSGFTTASVLRLRTEEKETRADLMLATQVGRVRWLMSHFTVAIVGSVVIVVGAGLLTAAGYSIGLGDWARTPEVLGASLAMVPALAVIAGFAVALIGVFPRAALAAWLGVVVSSVAAFLAVALDLPQWVRNLSPFTHVPALPAADLEVLPLLLLSATAVALTLLGVFGIRRRDIAVT